MSNLNDFSTEAIKKAVLKAALKNPLFLVFIATAFFGGVGAIAFFGNTIALIALGLGIFLGGVVFAINYKLRRPALEEEYLNMLKKRASDRTRKKLEQMEESIDDCIVFSENDPLVVQSKQQFKMINAKFDTFKKILGKKFDPNEITYGRFFTTGEQTHGAVLDSLERIVLSFEALKDIDLEYLEGRYDELKKIIDGGKAEEYDKKEFKTIQARIDLREKKFFEIDETLSNNEEAMTELSNIIIKLSEMKTHEGRSKLDLEQTLKDLNYLANSVSRYEIN